MLAVPQWCIVVKCMLAQGAAHHLWRCYDLIYPPYGHKGDMCEFTALYLVRQPTSSLAGNGKQASLPTT